MHRRKAAFVMMRFSERQQLIAIRMLADRWATHNLPEVRPCYVVHAMMAFVAAGRPAAAMRLAEALPSSQGNEASRRRLPTLVSARVTSARYTRSCQRR
jgi:hypothetical protein